MVDEILKIAIEISDEHRKHHDDYLDTIERVEDQITARTAVYATARHIATEIALDERLVVMTREQFKTALLEAFKEGQVFARENSLEGALSRMGREVNRATQNARVSLPAQNVVINPGRFAGRGMSSAQIKKLLREQQKLRVKKLKGPR